jgi:hypothetical protein
MRYPRAKRLPQGRGQLRDTLHISQRPAEAADRADWEGDLVFGRRPSAVGALVERHSRYVMLFPLPEGDRPPGPPGAHGRGAAAARAAASLPHLGPRPGDGRTCPVHRRLRCPGVVLHFVSIRCFFGLDGTPADHRQRRLPTREVLALKTALEHPSRSSPSRRRHGNGEHRHEPTVHHHVHLQVRSVSPCAAHSTSYALPTRPRAPAHVGRSADACDPMEGQSDG